MHLVVVPVMAAAALVASVADAHAEPPTRVTHVEAGSFNDCGFVINYDFTNTFSFFNREVPGSDDEAFRGQKISSFRNVLTNPATGEWLVLSGHTVDTELSARHVSGTIWEFTAQSAGQPFVITNSDGNVVVRDRGRTTNQFLFDTLGDGQPGGEIIDQQTTGVSGPHPSFGFDFCAVANDIIG